MWGWGGGGSSPAAVGGIGRGEPAQRGRGTFWVLGGRPPHPAVPLRLHPPRCEGGEWTRDGGTSFPPSPPALSRGKGDGGVAVMGIDPPKKGLPPTHTSKPVMMGAGAPRGVRARQSFVAGEVDVPLCPHPPRVVVVGEMLRVLPSSPPRVPPGAARSRGGPRTHLAEAQVRPQDHLRPRGPAAPLGAGCGVSPALSHSCRDQCQMFPSVSLSLPLTPPPRSFPRQAERNRSAFSLYAAISKRCSLRSVRPFHLRRKKKPLDDST